MHTNWVTFHSSHGIINYFLFQSILLASMTPLSLPLLARHACLSKIHRATLISDIINHSLIDIKLVIKVPVSHWVRLFNINAGWFDVKNMYVIFIGIIFKSLLSHFLDKPSLLR